MTETAVVTPPEKSNELCEARWKDYGLDLETLPAYNLRDITKEEAAAKGFSDPKDGIYIAYPRDRDSRIRWKLTGFGAATAAGKYGQRANTLPALYVPPPLVKGWEQRSDMPILITEGEFKAIVVDIIANGDVVPSVCPVAVAGVFSWQSAKRGIDVIDDIKNINWMGRSVYLAFDMDQNVNAMVSLAMVRVTSKLAELGAIVRVMQWPSGQGKGIDDYLTGHPTPKDAWLELVEGAQFMSHVAAVVEMNARFSYCEVQQQIYDIQNGTYITPKSFGTDFFTRKIRIQTGVKNKIAVMKDMVVGAYWMSSPLRSTVVEPCFSPGARRLVDHNGRTYLNTWAGWGQGLRNRPLEPVQGDVKPFHDFLNAAFAGEDPKHVEYLVKRLAWMFQQPDKKHPTWLYLMGRPYQGKSALIKIISSLVGEKYTANVDESIVKGQFAEWRAEKLLVTFDDSSITDPRVIRQLLKRLTTEAHSQVNLKYVKAQTTESYFSFVFASNTVDALLDHDDRRALVLEADCKWDFAKGEWKEFDTWRSKPASMQHLLHHLLYEVKIEGDFYSETPPKTSARELVIEVGESTWDDMINYFAMSKGRVQWSKPASGDVRAWKPTIFTIDMLRNIFLLRNGETEKFKATSATLVGKLVRYGARRCVPEGTTDTRKRLFIGDQQVSFWTWDYNWINKPKDAFVFEYLKLQKDLPELFPSNNHAKY